MSGAVGHSRRMEINSRRSKLIKLEGKKYSGATLEPQNVLADMTDHLSLTSYSSFIISLVGSFL